MSGGFTFGGDSSGAPSAPGSTSNQPTGLFGNKTPLNFGTGGATSGTPSSTPSTGLFGNKTPLNLGGATSGASPFGASTGTAQSGGGLFGGGGGGFGAQSGSGTQGAGTQGNIFGGGKPAATSGSSLFPTSGSTAPASGGLFGGGSTAPASGGMFGGLGTPSGLAPNTTTPAGSTTPAPKGFSFGSLGSTTPAGPPPSGTSSNIFGGNANNTSAAPSAGGLFSGGSTTPNTGGLFGGGSKPAGNLFGGGAPASTQQASTAAPTSSAPAPSLFSGLSSSTPAASTTKPAAPLSFGAPKSAATSTPGTAASSGGLFGGLSTGNATTTPASTPATGGLFGTPKPATTAAPSSNLFGGGPNTTNAASNPPTTASATTGGLFGSLGGGNASSGAPSTTQTSTAPIPTISTTQPTSSTAPSGAANTTATNTTQNATQPLGASTAGPAPQLTRLKNQTMDEIITRWASDLLKYQKEFQDQATKVAVWDRLLVENGDKIQKLFNKTYQAEKDSIEVERQLSQVESQQAELTAWLDRYETDVDEMFDRQVGQGESLQGPDQERERTYKLAEKLTDRLGEMGKNISTMIESINDASSNLSRSSKADDPLSLIVRVLNSHLTQLQWIDQNAEALQQKVTAAQKLSQSVNSNGYGYGAQESDPSDSFYRSMMGRR